MRQREHALAEEMANKRTTMLAKEEQYCVAAPLHADSAAVLYQVTGDRTIPRAKHLGSYARSGHTIVTTGAGTFPPRTHMYESTHQKL